MCNNEYYKILDDNKETIISEKCLNALSEDKKVKQRMISNLKKMRLKKIIVKFNDKKSEIIEKIEPYQTIKKADELYIYITDSYNQKFLKIILGNEYLLHITKGISIRSKIREKVQFIISESDLKTMLYNDILVLKENDILTSRLAIIVYRIANLNPFASTTECGRYFHKKNGSKSKTFSHNQFPTWGFKYAFRAYDLNVNEIEYETKKRIAKKLIDLKIKKLDKKKIAKVTDLPIDEINKL